MSAEQINIVLKDGYAALKNGMNFTDVNMRELNALYHIPTVGASGAVSAIVFAYIVIYPLRELGLIIIPGLFLPGFIFGILYLFAEHYLSKKQYSNIAHDAHISGSIFGIIFINAYDYNNLLLFFQKIIYYFQNF